VSRHSAERFEVRVQPAARRALAERLPEAVAAAVVEFLDGPLAEDPLRVGKRLAGPLGGCLGARRSTYSVTYRVDLDHRTVQVLDIDHRFTVYRRR
jgi:mRNA-degrading endonuclease RelE of RelBE toxin-antitoxin system